MHYLLFIMYEDVITIIFSFFDEYQKTKYMSVNKTFYKVINNDTGRNAVCEIVHGYSLNQIKYNCISFIEKSAERKNVLCLKWLLNLKEFSDRENEHLERIAIDRICYDEPFDVFKELCYYEKSKNNCYFDHIHFFNVALNCNNIACAEWICNNIPIDIILDSSAQMKKLCRRGNINALKWYYDKLQTNYNYSAVLSHDCMRDACTEGYLEVVKWLHLKGVSVDIPLSYPPFFTGSRLKIVKFMYSNGRTDKYTDIDRACECGDLKTAKWIYNLGGVDIHQNSEKIFRNACRHSNNLHIVKWIYSLGNVDIHACDDDAFVLACNEENIDIVAWLYSRGGININAQQNAAFYANDRKIQKLLKKWEKDALSKN